MLYDLLEGMAHKTIDDRLVYPDQTSDPLRIFQTSDAVVAVFPGNVTAVYRVGDQYALTHYSNDSSGSSGAAFQGVIRASGTVEEPSFDYPPMDGRFYDSLRSMGSSHSGLIVQKAQIGSPVRNDLIGILIAADEITSRPSLIKREERLGLDIFFTHPAAKKALYEMMMTRTK